MAARAGECERSIVNIAPYLFEIAEHERAVFPGVLHTVERALGQVGGRSISVQVANSVGKGQHCVHHTARVLLKHKYMCVIYIISKR